MEKLTLINNSHFEYCEALINHSNGNGDEDSHFFERFGASLSDLLAATQPAKLRARLSSQGSNNSALRPSQGVIISHSSPGSASPTPLFTNTLPTRFGEATLCHDGSTLFHSLFGPPSDPSTASIGKLPTGDPTLPLLVLFSEVLEQRHCDPIPLHLCGTPFQIAVWKALLKIRPGEVASYSRIAALAGHPRSHRAVGTAIGANPIAGMIPCHRIIRSNGESGNYRWGGARKRAMIGWEMAHFGKVKV
ncbi:MAG: methylated-DNA--[protein]-cysteine S-methyltransferase [Arenicellales bacterium]|jgi:O-6-methylguanine DNA methyltransferase|nr:hypothetical protein [Acidiferrobacteraceae bacterium]MDP6289891.1 methylated-DNA--[protein]-cysteine S-methyltransferase [Arenicellales bacterium]|tara:strand:- start:1018 stop:1761 length:744 start_codon:yes stop_codon:yes gene_type:complete